MLWTSPRLLASIAILTALPAAAASLDSPSIVLSGHARCMLANGKDAPGEVTVSFFDSTGAQLCQQQGTLPANGIASWPCAGLDDRGFCRIEGQFSKGKVKLTICDAHPAPGALGGCLAAASTH